MPLSPTQAKPPEGCQISPLGVVCLLQLVNPRWCISITRESIVHTRLYSQCGIFSGFRQVHSDMCPSLYHTVYFTALKPCRLPIHTYLSPPNLAATDLFTVSTYILFILPFLVVLNGNQLTFRSDLHCLPSFLLCHSIFSGWVAVLYHHRLFESKCIFRASTSSMKQALISTLDPKQEIIPSSYGLHLD